MLIIRGVNLFPSQVETVLLEMSGIKPHYLLIVDRVNNLDTLELKVEVDEAFFQDKISQLESLRQKLQLNLENSLGLTIKVTLVEPKMIERSEGKSQRVLDKRKF
jgi:phenylacetate-CoA ligase